MVKEIKELSAKLHVKCFIDLSVLNDRKIRVTKTGPDDDVAAQVSEARHCAEHRRIEPPFDAADRRDRASYVGPERITDPIHSIVTGDDVDRTAALNLNNRGKRSFAAFLP